MTEAWQWKLYCVSLFLWIKEIKLHKKLFNDVCISTLIDAAWIGVLAQLNKELFNNGLLTPSTRKSYNISLPQQMSRAQRNNHWNVWFTFLSKKLEKPSFHLSNLNKMIHIPNLWKLMLQLQSKLLIKKLHKTLQWLS